MKNERRWRYDIVPPWMEEKPSGRWRINAKSGGKPPPNSQTNSFPYYGLGPIKPESPGEGGYGVRDEPSPPCKKCGVEAICADFICGACGHQHATPHGVGHHRLTKEQQAKLSDVRRADWARMKAKEKR